MKNWKNFIRTQVMDYVERIGHVKRQDIIRFIKVINGKTYTNPTSERGYWGCQFSTSCNALLCTPRPYDSRYLTTDGHGVYHVTRD